jgi:hypothetical protein
LNEKQLLLEASLQIQKILAAINRKSCFRSNFMSFMLYIILAFLAGCLVTGLFFFGHRFASSGRLDKRYTDQHARAGEIITRLENELGQERELNRQLREHNNRARDIAVELTGTTERNVKNLSDAMPNLRFGDGKEIYFTGGDSPALQSPLSAKYEQRLKFWRNTTLIGIPAAALISGILVYVIVK